MKTHDQAAPVMTPRAPIAPSVDFRGREAASDEVRSRPAVPLPVMPARGWYLPVKRVFDFVGALGLLLLFAPIILVAIAATKVTSSGPAFYRQVRLGRDGRPFRICKIRTMVHDAEARTGAVWSPTHDPRVTPVGKFLRRSHIDEFPQLVQVLTGHMSLVGPRPERPEFVQRLQWEVPRYADRLNVKPGVTGLAQLLLPPDSDLDDVRRKVQYDLYYVRTVGPWLDLVIGCHTAWLLVKTLASAAAAPLGLPRQEVVHQWIAELDRDSDRRLGLYVRSDSLLS